MAYVINTAVKGTIWLRTDANAAITGKVQGDFATREAFDEDETAATLTITEINAATKPGAYRYAFTPTAAGKVWTGHIVYDSGGVRREWSKDVKVITAAQADPLGASVAGYAAGTAGARLALLGGGSAVITSPVSSDAETLTLVKGDDHTVANGNPIEFTEPEDGPSWPVLTGATVSLVITDLANAEVIDDAGTVVTATGDAKQVRFELTAAQTATLTPSRAVSLYRFGVVMTLAGETRTLVRGSVMVNRDQSP